MRRNINTRLGGILLSLMIIAPVFAGSNQGNSLPETEFADYMSNLKSKIKSNWVMPETVEEGHAVVVFKIDKNGNIISSEITESSGDEMFDISVEEALNKSEPFDTFPQDSSKTTLTIQYNFDTTLVKTDLLKEYVKKSEEYLATDNKKALEYINMAIDEADGNCSSYFLYARRAKIYQDMGNLEEAGADIEKSRVLKEIYNQKKIISCLKIAEEAKTPYSFFILSHAYDSAGDYAKAVEAIDKAISLTPLNNGYKRYREEIMQRQKS